MASDGEREYGYDTTRKHHTQQHCRLCLPTELELYGAADSILLRSIAARRQEFRFVRRTKLYTLLIDQILSPAASAKS